MINPSTENIFIVILLIPIHEFIFEIKEEKQISVWKILSPKFQIAKVILEDISKICSKMKYEEFIAIPKKSNLKINWWGDSISIE